MKKINILILWIYFTSLLYAGSTVIAIDHSVQVELEDYMDFHPVSSQWMNSLFPMFSGKLFFLTHSRSLFQPFLTDSSYLQIPNPEKGENVMDFYPYRFPRTRPFETYTDLYYGEGDYGFARFSAFQRIVMSTKRFLDFQLMNYSEYPQITNVFNLRKTKLISLDLKYYFILKKKYKASIQGAYFRNLNYLYNQPTYSTTDRELSFARKISFSMQGKNWGMNLFFQNGIYQLNETLYPNTWLSSVQDTITYYLNQHHDLFSGSFTYQKGSFQIENVYQWFLFRKNENYSKDQLHLFQSNFQYQAGHVSVGFMPEISGFSILSNLHTFIAYGNSYKNISGQVKAGYRKSRLPFHLRYLFPDSLKNLNQDIVYLQMRLGLKLFYGFGLTGDVQYFNQMNGKNIYPDGTESPFDNRNLLFSIQLIWQKSRVLFQAGYHEAGRYGTTLFRSVSFTGRLPIRIFNKITIINKIHSVYYFQINRFHYSFLFNYYYPYREFQNISVVHYYAYLPVQSFILYVGFENAGGSRFTVLNYDGYQTPQFRFGFIWRLYQ